MESALYGVLRNPKGMELRDQVTDGERISTSVIRAKEVIALKINQD